MKNFIVDRLDNYFKNNYVLNRVPLLIGPSGVAKSALIKEAARRNNMRVVDIRTAFMSRLDIEGLTEKIELNGKFYSQASPMLALIKCTDEYLRVARESCKIIEDEIMATTDPKAVEVLKESLMKLAEEAKTPVLLFDEISRGEASVRQVLTKILTDKAFMGYSMNEARVVAATNSQLDKSGNIIDIYSVNEAYDVAFYDRFESVYVSPEMMTNTWMKWAKKNFCKETLQMVEDSTPYESGHFFNTEVDEALVTPYPCFRTWEMADKYLRQGLNKEYVKNIIGGCKTLSMDEFVDLSIKSNTPALVISPSGLGKTARITKYCKDKNYEFISINLSEVDRIDLEGLPVKQETIKCMFQGIKINKNIAEKIREIFNNSTLPICCTVRAPKKEYVDMFNRALKTGNKVVIYFDECNRVQNVSVMSAIFQVISDNRLFGVDFDPTNVTTILSCNFGDNCGDAQSLDPALCARFAIWYKKSYDEKDANAFASYVDSKAFDQRVAAYLKSLSARDLKNIISSVETRTMEMSSASSRAWEDLSTTLKATTDKLLVGNTLVKNMAQYETLSMFFRYNKSGSAVEDVINSIKSRVSNMAIEGFDDDDEFVLSGKARSGKDLVDTIKKFFEQTIYEIMANSTLLSEIISVDQAVWDYRRDYFKMMLGDKYEDFLNFFNSYEDIKVSVFNSVKSEDIARVTEENILGGVDVLADLANSIEKLYNDGATHEQACRAFRVYWRVIRKNLSQDQMKELFSKFSMDTVLYADDKSFRDIINKDLGVKDFS